MKPRIFRLVRSFAIGGVFAGLLAGFVAAGAQAGSRLPKATGVATPSIQRPMSNLRPLATFELGGDPDWLALTGDSVWVASAKMNRVIRLDAATNRVAESVSVRKPCSGLAAGFGSLWAPSCEDHTVV